MRQPVIAGNWKMYKTQSEARALITALKPMVAGARCDVIVAPPFTALAATAEAAADSNIRVAAQDLYWGKEGAFTGEISPRMLLDAGCRAVIIGHSERRQFFCETNETANRKVKAALANDLTPILCVGELLAERESDQTYVVLETQFVNSLASLTVPEFSRILVAYEPVWAIGTGLTATPDIAAQAHRFIRELAGVRFGSEAAQALRILYGGSVKPDNIKPLMAEEEIDGALVGGASLDAKQFAAIVNY